MTPSPDLRTSRARGPLVVSNENPRYFSVDGDTSRRAVYLTGSHVWNNFHDGLGPGRDVSGEPERFDFSAYLRFLVERGHNCIRLWRWEHIESQAAGGAFHMNMSPQPWERTGPGMASDGMPRFDLSQFNPSYFERLRDRVREAGDAGVYVIVMLFDGFGLHLSPAPDHVAGHPFHAGNNVNHVGIRSIRDYQVLPLDPCVLSLQAAYVRRVIDAVHDLPNVLYEIANESCGGGIVDAAFAQMLGLDQPPDWGDSTGWQYWVLDVVRQHEHEHGYAAHPAGMTMQFPVANQSLVNTPLYASTTEWISPGYDDECFCNGGHPGAMGAPESRWYDDPPPNDQRKVVLSDTDHYASGRGDARWAWKSFVRGHHTLLMDFGIIDVVHPLDPSHGVPSFESFEPVRLAMGDTRRFAERMGLIDMTPRGDLTSTGYALASVGREYLVLQPDATGAAFTVDLAAGEYLLEWFAIEERVTMRVDTVVHANGGPVTCTPPGNLGACVAYLSRVDDFAPHAAVASGEIVQPRSTPTYLW